MKATKVLLNITSFFCFIYFALYIFTLVFIPIGIYCFLAGKRFAYKADHLGDNYKLTNINFKKYVIFVSIFCFPFGLLSIIPYVLLTSNKVKVTDLKYSETSSNSGNYNSTTNDKEPTSSGEENIQSDEIESDEEKIEKYKKLQNFKEKGLITEEELLQAKEQLFGKSDENE